MDIGLVAALALGRELSTSCVRNLRGLSLMLAAVAALLCAVSLVACLVPALRADRVSSIRALRDE